MKIDGFEFLNQKSGFLSLKFDENCHAGHAQKRSQNKNRYISGAKFCFYLLNIPFHNLKGELDKWRFTAIFIWAYLVQKLQLFKSRFEEKIEDIPKKI